MTGFLTLFHKEMLRFWKVAFQTIAAPVLTATLYLLIFSQVLADHVRIHDLPYTAFLVPGLVMMQMMQNAFANTSSSLIQGRVTGSIVFVLLPPISYGAFFAAYVLAAVLRGLLVGLGVWLVTLFFSPAHMVFPGWVLLFALLGGLVFAALGVIAGIWAEKFDQLAAFQNFLIMPLTMLSGVFYSLHSLPPLWQTLSRYNPVFYMIDGLRYGFFGVSDVPVSTSVTLVAACAVLVTGLSLEILRRGWKLRY